MSNKFGILWLIIGLGLQSCLNPFRGISSTGKDHLLNIISNLRAAVDLEISSTKYCHEELQEYYRALFHLKSKNIDPNQFTVSEIDQVITQSFSTRLVIKEKLKQLEIQSKHDRQCLFAVKEIFRALRYVEDYFIELKAFQKTAELKKEDFTNLKGESPYFLINPKFKFRGIEDLQSGDVILSRGNAYSSAAIARIGNSDMQFSHLSLVYKDEAGKLWTSEAHIEIGSVVAPIDVHINQKNARTVIFRFKDSKLAHQAAKTMYEIIKPRQEEKKNIPYDFAMNYHNEDKIFCTEVIHLGYKKASKGTLDIPKYKTKFTKGMIPFLQNLGVEINKSNYKDFNTFAPGDIQFDPHFELVAEWRNPISMKDSRIKDMILTKLFEWMEKENYQFRPHLKMNLTAKLSWLIRRTPFIKKFLEEKFPLNMNTTQLKLFLVLDKVSASLQNFLEKEIDKARRPLSPLEMYSLLDAYKKIDYKKWQKYKEFKKQLSERDHSRSPVPLKIRRGLRQNKPEIHLNFHP